MPVILLPVIVVLAAIVMMPLALVQRFRTGRRRRQARGWVAALNLFTVLLSAVFLIAGSAVIGRWVPDALAYTLAGLGFGSLLGGVGVLVTRWEDRGGVLWYTQNTALVLTVTLIVAGRVLYGLWRSWEAWRVSLEQMAWVSASGVAGSMSAGAVVLGYYLVFWTGVRARVSRYAARHAG